MDWLLSILFTIIAAAAERNLPLFIFATFIPFTKSLDVIYTKSISFTHKYIISKVFLFLIVCAFISWQLKDIIAVNSFGFGIPIGASKAVDYMEKNNIHGPIFNNFDVGSYLDYRLYPKDKVFVDARPEAYPASFFQNYYIPIEQDKTMFEKADEKYHFNTIFISHTDPTPWNQQFLRDMNTNKDWKIVYLDPLVIIFIRNNLQNQRIKNYSILSSTKLLQSSLTKNQLISLVLFYENLGWTGDIKIADQKLLDIDPNFCFALRDLGTLLSNENDQTYVIYVNKYNSVCAQ